MSGFVKNKLTEWNLASLQESFERNQIDEETFMNLEDEDIKELIPILGLRKKFVQKYTVLRHITRNDKTPDKTDTESLVSEELSEDLNVSTVSSDSSSAAVAIPSVNRHTSFCGIDDIDRSLGLKFPDFDLKSLLRSVPFGNSILTYYEKNQKLDDTLRTKLVDIITKHLYNYYVAHRLKHDQYLLLCKKITELFPNEADSAYYIPYVPKRLSGQDKGILARGRLVDKLRNILYKSGDTVTHKRKLTNVTGEASACKKSKHKLSESEEDSLAFLKNFREPWEDIVQHWQSTINLRQNSDVETVNEFIETWPILKDLRAEQLINLDFEKKFGQKCALSIFETWDFFIKKVITVEGTSKIRDKEVVENFSQISEESSKDSKHFSEINLLCHLLPPKGRTKIEKRSCKFSIRESVESIIKLSPSPSDVEQIIRETKEHADARKFTVQPYLLVVGSNFQDIHSIFLILDSNIRYQFDSVLKGFDTLFKLFHVFNARYPAPSEHIWMLVQKAVYKIHTEHDKPYPYIMHLLKAFNNQ